MKFIAGTSSMGERPGHDSKEYENFADAVAYIVSLMLLNTDRRQAREVYDAQESAMKSGAAHYWEWAIDTTTYYIERGE